MLHFIQPKKEMCFTLVTLNRGKGRSLGTITCQLHFGVLFEKNYHPPGKYFLLN